MKRTPLILSSLILGAGISMSAHAQTITSQTAPVSQTPAANNTMSHSVFKHKQNQACKNIVTACEAAGYNKAHTAGKNVWHDCVKNIVGGKTIADVKTNPNDVTACKAHLDKRKSKHMNRMNKHQPQATPAPTVTPESQPAS